MNRNTPVNAKSHRLALAILALAAANHAAAADLPARAPEAPSSRAESTAARQLVDTVIRSRRLAPEDVAALKDSLAKLSKQEAFELRARIANAINTRAIVPTQVLTDLP